MVIEHVDIQINALFGYLTVFIVVVPYAYVLQNGRLVIGIKRERIGAIGYSGIVPVEKEFEIHRIFAVRHQTVFQRRNFELHECGSARAAAGIRFVNTIIFVFVNKLARFGVP